MDEVVRNYARVLAEKSDLETQLNHATTVNGLLTEENKKLDETLAVKDVGVGKLEGELMKVYGERDTLMKKLEVSDEWLTKSEQDKASIMRVLQRLITEHAQPAELRAPAQIDGAPQRWQSMSESSPGGPALQHMHSQPRPSTSITCRASPIEAESKEQSSSPMDEDHPAKVPEERLDEVDPFEYLRRLLNESSGHPNSDTREAREAVDKAKAIKVESDDDGDIINSSSGSLQERISALARQIPVKKLTALIIMMENGTASPGMTASQVNGVAVRRFGITIKNTSLQLSNLIRIDHLLRRPKQGYYQMHPDYDGMKLFEYKDFGELETLYTMASQQQPENQADGDAGHEDLSVSTSSAGRAPGPTLEESRRKEIVVKLKPLSGGNKFNHRPLFTALGNSLMSLLPQMEHWADDGIRLKVQESLKDLPPALLKEYIALSHGSKKDDLPPKYHKLASASLSSDPADHQQLVELAAKVLDDRHVNVRPSGKGAHILIGLVCQQFNRPCHLILRRTDQVSYACITKPLCVEEYKRESQPLTSLEIVRRNLGAEQFIMITDGSGLRFTNVTVGTKSLLDGDHVGWGMSAILEVFAKGWDVFGEPINMASSHEADVEGTSTSQDIGAVPEDIRNDVTATQSRKRTRSHEAEENSQSKRVRLSASASENTKQTLHTSHDKTVNEPILIPSDGSDDVAEGGGSRRKGKGKGLGVSNAEGGHGEVGEGGSWR
ncbi:hypothetical protein HDV00_004025 [Rhizophlyctis rosea]|nr:hypothetical protein HDV00_004025 [Rhizophlyctis rosea]